MGRINLFEECSECNTSYVENRPEVQLKNYHLWAAVVLYTAFLFLLWVVVSAPVSICQYQYTTIDPFPSPCADPVLAAENCDCPAGKCNCLHKLNN